MHNYINSLTVLKWSCACRIGWIDSLRLKYSRQWNLQGRRHYLGTPRFLTFGRTTRFGLSTPPQMTKVIAHNYVMKLNKAHRWVAIFPHRQRRPRFLSRLFQRKYPMAPELTRSVEGGSGSGEWVGIHQILMYVLTGHGNRFNLDCHQCLCVLVVLLLLLQICR